MPNAPDAQAREQITRLLVEWGNGNKQAIDLLTPLVYSELRKLAASYLNRERNAATLQPTALVHEAYLRLVAQDLPDWESRSHFFAVAATLMRQILVDHARKIRSLKRGGDAVKMTLTPELQISTSRAYDLVGLDVCLSDLARFDERKARIIELRFFGGLSVEETAQTLHVSVATVGREQRLAEAWLHKQMTQTAAAASNSQ